MIIKSKEDAIALKRQSLALADEAATERAKRERAREEDAPQTRAGERDAVPAPEDQGSGLGPWRLPAPASGGTYTQTELAALLNVKVCTVRDWVARGQRGIKLQTLRAPRGRVTPAAVCVFLEAVNGIEVGIEERR